MTSSMLCSGLTYHVLHCGYACVPEMPLLTHFLHFCDMQSLTNVSLCSTMQYKHVGSPIFLDRTGEALPGEYMAFRGERPEWYTGSIGDHVSGYILGIKQAAECTVRP